MSFPVIGWLTDQETRIKERCLHRGWSDTRLKKVTI